MNLETWKPPFALDTKLLGVSASTDIGTQGQGLKAEGQSLKGIYAGQKGRQSMRPSTELLLDGFKEINAVVGKVKGEFFVLLDPLSEAQKRILRLIRLDDDLYQNFLSYFQKPAPG